jgi:hypothetical protein
MGGGGVGGAGSMGVGGAGTTCGTSCLAGGGGGGYGFILLQNATGSVGASGVVSPPIGSTATFVTPVASQ